MTVNGTNNPRTGQLTLAQSYLICLVNNKMTSHNVQNIEKFPQSYTRLEQAFSTEFMEGNRGS